MEGDTPGQYRAAVVWEWMLPAGWWVGRKSSSAAGSGCGSDGGAGYVVGCRVAKKAAAAGVNLGAVVLASRHQHCAFGCCDAGMRAGLKWRLEMGLVCSAVGKQLSCIAALLGYW
jgi:hypothetical protein